MIHQHENGAGLHWKPACGPALLAALLTVGLAIARPAAAQTINVSATQLSGIGNLAPGQEPPRLYGDPVGSVSGRTVIGMNEPNWSEYTFNVETAGLYNVVLNYATPLSDVSVTLDVHKAGSTRHYAVYGVNTPSTNDWVGFQNAAAVSMPLEAGTNIIRVHNLGSYNKVPHTSGRTGNGLNIGGFTLTRTGNLPATGTISGTVSASDLGVNVGGAVVMALDPAKTVAEPSLTWYNGYWTTTAADGSFSLAVPAGTYTVQAGRPDTYALAGGTKTGVVVTAGGTANGNVSMASRWAANALTVEAEDYHGKRADVIGGAWDAGWGTQVATWASAGRALGWIDTGDYGDYYVDVPAAGAGWYRIDHVYQNGGATGTVRYTTDRGSSSQDTTPNTGNWDVTQTKSFAQPIYLFPGRNEIRALLVGPNSNFDAFKLTKVQNTATAARVELENYVNFGAGSGASVTGGSGGVNLIPNGNATGLDGQKVSGSSIGSYSIWSQGGTPEYLEFTVNAPSTGLYTMTLRAGTPVASVTLRTWNLSYGPIIDNTFLTPGSNFGEGDYNQWVGPNMVPLMEGPNRVRIYITDAGMNADWVEFSRTADLTGYGLASGTVTAGGVPVPNAQVYADTSLDNILGGTALGTRAITDAQGRYNLLVPNGAHEVQAAALGYDDPTAAGQSASVDFLEGTPRTQNLTLTRDNKYEAEWYTNAWQNFETLAKDHGVAAVDVIDASQGQVVASFGTFQGIREYTEYAVNVPAAGLYNLTLHYAHDNLDLAIRVTVPQTGVNIRETVPSSGGFSIYGDYTLSSPIVLQAGLNTIRVTNDSETGEVNFDYFTLAETGQQAGTVTGTVTNTTVTPNVPVADVEISARNTATDTVVATTTTNATGQYTLQLPAGTYQLTPFKTGYTGAPQNAVVTSGGSVTVNFSLTQGLITGKVTNQLGEPIANTPVRAYPDMASMAYDPNNAAYNSFKLNETVTDAEGNYELAIRQGSAVIVAGAPLSIPAIVTVNANPTATANLVVTKLEGGTPVDLAFNEDWFSETGPPVGPHTVDGIFSLPADKDQWTPQEAYGPTTVTLFGVPFKIGDPRGSELNVLSSVTPNNVIDVPNGQYSAAVVLGTSSNGNWPSDNAFLKQGTTPADPLIPIDGAVIHYTDGSTSTALFHLPNWGYNQGAYGKPFRENAWEIIQWASRNVDGAGREPIKFNGVAVVLPVNPAKTVDRITLPEDLSMDTNGTNPFVFAVTMANAAVEPMAKTKAALKIAAGLQAATNADLTSLNVVNTGTSASKIDVADAVSLAKQGQ